MKTSIVCFMVFTVMFSCFHGYIHFLKFCRSLIVKITALRTDKILALLLATTTVTPAWGFAVCLFFFPPT